jgi:hypothetical protein
VGATARWGPPSGGWGPPPGPPSGGWGSPPGRAGPPTGGLPPQVPTPALPGQGRRPAPGEPGHLLPYRPLTVGDVLDGAFRLLRPTFTRAALLVLLVVGPYQLLSNLVFARLVPELSDPGAFAQPGVEFDPVELLARVGGWGVVLQVLGLLVHVIVGAAVVALAGQADRAEPLDVLAALRTAVARSGATVGGSVLMLVAGVLALLVVVPVLVGVAFVPILGIVVVLAAVVFGFGVAAGAYSLIVPVAVVEDRGAWTTFTRALWVLRVRFWRVVGVTLLVSLLLALVGFAVVLPLGLLSFVAGPLGWIVDGAASTVVSLLVVPVTAYAALLVYLDARVRREGLDLELRTRRIGG